MMLTCFSHVMMILCLVVVTSNCQEDTCQNGESSQSSILDFLKQYGYNEETTKHVKDEINKKWMINQFEDKKNGYISKFNFDLEASSISGDDWYPTPHGWTFAEALAFHQRSKEIIENQMVLELGSGVGIHTILIAQHNPSQLYVTELTQSRLDITRDTMKLNSKNNKIANTFDINKNMKYIEADWLHLHSLDNDNIKFDTIITNPPFAASGKQNRKYFIDEIILNSHKYLKDNGFLMFVQSSMADIQDTIKNLEKNGYYNIEILVSKKYYWRDYYWKDETFVTHCDNIQKNTKGNAFLVENETGKRIETLYVIKAQLRSYKKSAIAH